MKTVGQILRDARESKGLTVAQAVEGTRSQSQVIQALEQDDFSRFPAPIYTRGFIKLYAEYLGLDASELISLYQARNAEADKLVRPASVLRPGSSHPPAAPAQELAPELDFQSPAPSPEAVNPTDKSEPVPPPLAPKPVASELELPFDRPAAPPPSKPAPRPGEAVAPKLPAPAEAPKLTPPKVPPVLPEAPRTLAPRLAKPAPAKPPATSSESDEFALEVRTGSDSVTARERAASIFSLARASAGRLPWGKILIRTGGLIVAFLMLWLLLSVVRSCVNRYHRSVVKAEASAASYALPPVPEPPPLHLPDKLPRR